MIKILRVDLHFSPNSSYIFIHVYCKLLITKYWAYNLAMGFERVYRQQGGGGGLVAGYNKTKKSVSKQDMLQC